MSSWVGETARPLDSVMAGSRNLNSSSASSAAAGDDGSRASAASATASILISSPPTPAIMPHRLLRRSPWDAPADFLDSGHRPRLPRPGAGRPHGRTPGRVRLDSPDAPVVWLITVIAA